MNFNVEDYIGDIVNMAWNRGYDVSIDENNDILMEHKSDFYAATIKAKFMHSGSIVEPGDEFWYNVEMIFPKSKLTFEEGTQYGFKSITKQWNEAATIAEKLNEVSWYIEED